MKPQRIASLLLLAGIALAGAASASAGTLYENGPVTSANVAAWNINFGFSVTDSVVANGNGKAFSSGPPCFPATRSPALKSRWDPRPLPPTCSTAFST